MSKCVREGGREGERDGESIKFTFYNNHILISHSIKHL